MSNQYDNQNKGALFSNKKKRDDRDPGYQGSINVNGVDFWLSAWIQTSKAGEKYFSLRVNPKEATSKPTAQTKPKQEDEDSGIPF